VGEFWKLLRESVILQAVLSLLLWSTICYMYLQGRTVPGELLTVGGAIIGFYFGTKVATIASNH
jgi:hypothetical protein